MKHLNQIKSIILIGLFFFLSNQAFAFFTFHGQLCSDPNSDLVKLEIRTENFTNILSYQFSFHWNAADLEYVAIEDIDDDFLTANFSIQNAQNGVFTTSWLDQFVTGASKPDATHVFSIVFKKLKTDISPDFSMDGNPTPIEVANSQGDFGTSSFVFNEEPCDNVSPVWQTEIDQISMKIQPNIIVPNGVGNLNLRGDNSTKLDLKIVSLTGRVLYDSQLEKVNKTMNFEFIAPEQRGMYFIQLLNEKGEQKVVRFFVK